MTPLSASRIEELRRLAEKATPGEWRHGPLWWEVWGIDAEGSMTERLVEIPTVRHSKPVSRRPDHEADAAYIAAASPETVLALLAEVVAQPDRAGASRGEAPSEPEEEYVSERARQIDLLGNLLSDLRIGSDVRPNPHGAMVDWHDYHEDARRIVDAAGAPQTPSLDDAWAAAEAALPEGWGVQITPGQPEAWEATAVIRDIPNRRYPRSGTGDTSAAALLALAARLTDTPEAEG